MNLNLLVSIIIYALMAFFVGCGSVSYTHLCHRMVHNSPIPPELNAKTVGKIMKYREKLKT